MPVYTLFVPDSVRELCGWCCRIFNILGISFCIFGGSRMRLRGFFWIFFVVLASLCRLIILTQELCLITSSFCWWILYFVPWWWNLASVCWVWAVVSTDIFLFRCRCWWLIYWKMGFSILNLDIIDWIIYSCWQFRWEASFNRPSLPI